MRQCDCDGPGFCRRYGCVVSARQIEYCKGTSGLGKEKEEFFLGQLLLKRSPEQDEKEVPSVLQLGKNYAKALLKHALNGFKHVAEEDRKARLEVCRGCPQRIPPDCPQEAQWRCAHPDCGCWLDEKARWGSEDCPEKKWPAISLPLVQGPQTGKKGGCCGG